MLHLLVDSAMVCFFGVFFCFLCEKVGEFLGFQVSYLYFCKKVSNQ